MDFPAALLLALALLADAAVLWAKPASTSAPTRRDLVLVTDWEALRKVEEAAGSLGELLEGRTSRGFSNELLSERRRFGDVVSTIEKDLKELGTADPRLGVGVANVHRLFDAGWLRSPEARFDLVGIANRLDRRPFNDGSCGEIRFLYRLGYDTSRGRDLATAQAPPHPDHTAPPGAYAASRLPMTVSLVFFARDENNGSDCRSIARRWLPPAALSGKELGAWLLSEEGPLAPPFLSWYRIKSLDVNLQAGRWPAPIREDMGGHAEYLLRSFRPDNTGKHMVPAPLENTPDTRRLKKDPFLREDLLKWLSDPANLARIDEGTARIPEKFLAFRALSAAPHGLQRRANRPFRQVYKPEEFSRLGLKKTRHVGSPEAFLRRLDMLSCMGCHQSRSVAGFHFLGEEPPGALTGNALAVWGSPHLYRDLGRRRAYLRETAFGRKPSDEQPSAERPADGADGYGAHCGLGDPGFKSWTCAKGLACSRHLAEKDDNTVGQCFPAKAGLGDPCEVGTLTPMSHLHQDYVDDLVTRPCGEGRSCERNKDGFPGGMCASTCALLKDKSGICGSISQLEDFSACLARNASFSECFGDHVRPIALRACDDANPCRDDYVCTRTSSAKGACLPPFYLFQLRVDGHAPSGLK